MDQNHHCKNLPMVGMVVTTARGGENKQRKQGHEDGSIHSHPSPKSGPVPNDQKLTLSKFQLVKDGGFTGGIKTNHKDTHLLLAELFSLPQRNTSMLEKQNMMVGKSQ